MRLQGNGPESAEVPSDATKSLKTVDPAILTYESRRPPDRHAPVLALLSLGVGLAGLAQWWFHVEYWWDQLGRGYALVFLVGTILGVISLCRGRGLVIASIGIVVNVLLGAAWFVLFTFEQLGD
jgi:hypothetical protein